MYRAWNVALDSEGVVRKTAGDKSHSSWDAVGLLYVPDPRRFEASATRSSCGFFFGVAPAGCALPNPDASYGRVVTDFLIANPGARLVFSGNGDEEDLEMYHAPHGTKETMQTGLGRKMVEDETLAVRYEEGRVVFTRGLRCFQAERLPPGEYHPCVFIRKIGGAVNVKISRKRQRDSTARDERIWRERKFTDLTVSCEGQRFLVHRNIVYTASPVFERMLEGGLREAQESEIDIRDAAPEVVEAMLQHIYTGSVPEGVDPAALFSLAMRFGLEGLAHEMGVVMLEEALTAENVRARARVLALHSESPAGRDLWERMLQKLRRDEDEDLLGSLLEDMFRRSP